MVKNIPTIERSTKIRFGKNTTDDQGENTIVLNASNTAINASSGGSLYISPVRLDNEYRSKPEVVLMMYNTETKELVESGETASDLIGNQGLAAVTNQSNVTADVVRFVNNTTAFVTESNVGIANSTPEHTLSVGSNLYVDGVGSNVLVVHGNVSATSYHGDGSQLTGLVTTLQDVSDNGGNTTTNTIEFKNSTTGVVVDSNVVVGGNVTATTYLGDGSQLTGLVTTLQDVSDNGNTTSNTLQFTNAHTAFTTDLISNVEVNLNQLANVTLTTAQNEDILVYDGTNWTNQLQNHTFLEAKALETISKGDVVYGVGHTGNNIVDVRKARSDSSTTMPALGVAYQDLTVNDVGLIVTFGRADGLNTDDFVSSETVYVSNVVAGGISNVAPQAETDLIQNVGFVVKPHASTGVIDVTGVGRVNAIPNAQVVTTQPPHIYTNGGGNTFEKMDPADVLTKLQTLQQVTDTGNTTSNTIQFTNATTGLVTTANLEVGSNISVSGLADSVNKYLPMVDNDGTFIQSPVYVTSGGTYVISASEAEFLGNITLGGNNTVVSSTSVTIEDRIFGIGANNAVHNLDTGIMMEHKDDDEYANVALIYHADEHRFSMSYTQNTFTDNHILHYEDPDHRLLIDLRGNLVVQNNATFNETLDVLGELTTSSNVGIASVSTNHTLNVGSNLYVDDVGSNVLVVTGNVAADTYHGDGSKLTGLVTTLQDVSDNGNTTSNVIQFTNADTAFIATGGIITNTGGVTKKTYSFTGDMGSGATPTAATIGIVFSQHVFYAKIVAHLIQADNEVSTISIEASGGHRTGGTPLNVAKGPASVFGNTNTNPWSSVVTTNPTTLFIKPSGTLSQLGNYNVFIEFISEHSDGKVVKITEGGVDEVTFTY